MTQTQGIDGIVLRYGWLYGPGTDFAPDGFIAGEVRKRRYPVIGSGKGITSFVHTEDAAGATVAAIENGRARDLQHRRRRAAGAPGLAAVVCGGARREAAAPHSPPGGAPGRGPVVAQMATEMRGASNAKAKRELGCSPRYPSVRDGFEFVNIR